MTSSLSEEKVVPWLLDKPWKCSGKHNNYETYILESQVTNLIQLLDFFSEQEMLRQAATHFQRTIDKLQRELLAGK
jgi:hypothetical protein